MNNLGFNIAVIAWFVFYSFLVFQSGRMMERRWSLLLDDLPPARIGEGRGMP
jgi:hypothetical protein